jgi:hypothetical protein
MPADAFLGRRESPHSISAVGGPRGPQQIRRRVHQVRRCGLRRTGPGRYAGRSLPSHRKEPDLENVQLPVQWAPQSLDQPILPGGQFSLFNVNVGASTDAASEKALIQDVGSYGRQIGHVADALEVVIKLLDPKTLSPRPGARRPSASRPERGGRTPHRSGDATAAVTSA